MGHIRLHVQAVTPHAQAVHTARHRGQAGRIAHRRVQVLVQAAVLTAAVVVLVHQVALIVAEVAVAVRAVEAADVEKSHELQVRKI